MVLATKAIGARIKLMERENSGMLTAIFMKAIGRMTKQMATVCMFMLTEQDMRATGRTIFKMEVELRLGQMAANTKESTKKVKSMARVNISGTMVLSMMETGMRIR